MKGLSEVRVAGNYAFAVSYYNTSFEVFNVANPAQPVPVAVLRNGDGGAVLSEPIGMDVQGDFAYVNNKNGSVEVIDISDPTKPKHAATVLDGQGGAVLKDLNGGIRVRGNYLYIVGRGAAVLEIIDISDPYKPFHAGLLNNGSGGASLANPYDLDFKDDFLFVTSYDANALEVLDISNPVSPKHVSTLFNGTGGAVLTRPHNVKVLGNLAYITNNYDNNLEIIDVSDPANPVHAGNFSSYPGFGTLLTPHGIDAVGRYPVVTSQVDGLWLLDANSPNAIKPYAVKPAINPVALNVFINGRYVYVASFSDPGGLTIFELSGLSIPNTAPTRLTLSKRSIVEGKPAGSIVGNFMSTDMEGGGVEYSLVAGAGGDDNSFFSLSGAALKTSGVFAYTTRPSYNIRVRVTDSGGLFREEAFTINVLPGYLPGNGLVGWWPFNGNANDESGNAHEGLVLEALPVQDRFGNSSKAYDFDGVNDYINVNSINNTFFENDFSLSLWVNSDNYENDYAGIV
ncbi:MAG: hypothetical protein ACKORJ_00510, partial [Bacteroidota bacterium]